MKKILLAALTIASLSVFAESEKRVKSEVKSVLVFLKKAQITCEVRTEAEAGITKIIVTGVPGDLKTEEIQVRGKGDGVIASVAFRSKSTEMASKPKEIILMEDSLEHLKFEIDSITQMEEILKAEEQMVYANKDIKSTEKGVKAHDVEDMADLYRDRLVALRGIIIKNRTKRDKLQRKRDKVFTKIGNYSKAHGEIVITVSANSKSPIVLDIDYLVNEAGWRPVYDLKTKNIKEPMTVVYKAFVHQNSKISWDNIRLTLSSGSFNGGAHKPVLPRWTIGFQENRMNKKMDIGNALQGRVAGVNIEKIQAEEAEALQTMATMENFTEEKDKGLVTEYEITTPYTILSDGTPQLVEIKSAVVQPEFKHIAIPKTEKDPVIIAQIMDWEKLNLLAGTANIYFSDSYIGSTNIDPNNMRDTLEVPIVKDKKVIVTRDRIKDFTSKKLIGLNMRQEYGYLITIRNANKEAVNVTLQDQIPLSQDSQIEVEFVNDSNAKYDPITGKLSWEFHIDPTETKKVIFKFAVKYPKDKIVNGL
jgi:uncharacterized protein (TIGR02231 family)